MVAPALAPSKVPAPLEGQDLNRFLQQWIVGIVGLAGEMVRPRWQAEPGNIPNAGDAWMAFGIRERPSDTFPFVGHKPDVGEFGSNELQRNEELNLLCSFYDLGTNGLADDYCARLRDGVMIEQNRDPLYFAGMGLVDTGEPTPVPSLFKARWLYRVDLRLTVRRLIQRIYAVPSLASAEGEIIGDGTQTFIRPFDVEGA